MESRIFQISGHLIDTGLMSNILNQIMEEQWDYQILQLDVGKLPHEDSSLELQVDFPADQEETVLEILGRMGCREKVPQEAQWEPCPRDSAAPSAFYSTTNHVTQIYAEGKWHDVGHQRMDAVIVKDEAALNCRKLRDLKKGDLVLVSPSSVRIFPPSLQGEKEEFSFMNAEVSSERSIGTAVKQIANLMEEVKTKAGKIVIVSGPVVIHTGGALPFSSIIDKGYVQGVLAGNALAVHDIESVLYGTSLGVDLENNRPVPVGHMHHMKAINQVYQAGSIKAMVDQQSLDRGVMYSIIRNNIPYCLAGSIRDDGPLPETEVDMIAAQGKYAEILQDCDMVLMLSSMLHAIGTGNMLPSRVTTVCVDINPAVVTKLSDRGSSQALGIVSDVGLFLRMLDQELS